MERLAFMNTRPKNLSLNSKMWSQEDIEKLNATLDARVKERQDKIQECKEDIARTRIVQVDERYFKSTPSTYRYALETTLEALPEDEKIILKITDEAGENMRICKTKKEFEEYIEARHFYFCSILKPKICGSCNTAQLLDGYKYCHNPACKRDPWYNASIGFFMSSQKAINEERMKHLKKEHINKCNNPNCDCGDIQEPVIQGGEQEIRFHN